MVNYQNGKIYKIEDVGGNMCYIGSTTKDFLSKRMAEHRGAYNRWKNQSCNQTMVYGIFDKYDIDNCRIVLIELYPCDTKDQLTSREAHFIRTLECVNKYIPGRTNNEYVEDNKEHILEYRKQYYVNKKEHIKRKVKIYNIDHKLEKQEYLKKYREENREKIYAKQKEVIQCECGSTGTRGHKKEHLKSQKHIKYISNQPLNV